MLTAFVVLVLALPWSASAENLRQELVKESTLETVLARGVLRVGMDIFQPWAMKDKSGDLIGFEIDVATRLAKDLGVEVEFVPTKWSGIIPALLSGKFDVIIGGMTITTQRNIKVNFTVPYNATGVSMVAGRETAPGLTRLEEFNRPDMVIAAKLGTSGADAVKKFLPQAKHVFFDDEPQGLQEVLNGRAMAFVGEAPFPEHQAYRYGDKLYLPFEEPIVRNPHGFAIRKADLDFLNLLNNWIIIASADGWLEERRAYWFSTLEWEPLVR